MKQGVRHLLICLALLTAVTTNQLSAAVPLDTPERRDREQSHFAINGSKIFHIPDQVDGVVAQRFDWMEELGVYWDRIDIWWHVLEPEKGRFDFSRSDMAFDEFEKRGVQWYPILCYGSAWFDGHTAPLTDEDFEDFANYAYHTVSRYKDRVTYWSVWNEPNIAEFWKPEPRAEDYARLLRLTREAVRRADPDAKLGAPSLAPPGRWDRKFTERLYQLGAADDFDVFDYHYYRQHAPEGDVPQELAEIRAVMARYGDADKPIWITESGVTGVIHDPVELDRQASLVARNQLLCLALGVERFFYFDLQNWFDHEGTWDGQLGLVSAAGDKKPSFTAYQTMVNQVDYKRFVGRHTELADGVEAALIHDEDKNDLMLAVWAVEYGAEHEMTFVCEARDVMVVRSLEGVEVLEMKPPRRPGQHTREVTLTITHHPTYIHSVDADTHLPHAGVRLDPPMIIMAPHEVASLSIHTDKLMEGITVRSVRTDMPDGFVWSPESGSVRVVDDLDAGRYTIRTTLEVSGAGLKEPVLLERSAEIEIVPILTVGLRPYLDGEDLLAGVTLYNQSGRTMNEAVRLVEMRGDERRVLTEDATAPLEDAETRVIDLSVAGSVVQDYREVTFWQAEFGPFTSEPFAIYPVAFSGQGPAVDGDLSDWEGLPAMVLDREDQLTRNTGEWTPANLSGRVMAWLTPDTLYIAADVTDDEPIINPNPPNEIWKGDGLEFYLGLRGPTRRTIIDKSFEYQLGVAPTYEGGEPIAFWYHEDVVIEDARVAFSKRDGGYIMEAAIPLAALRASDFSPAVGDLIAIDVALDDLDSDMFAPAGNLPGRAMMWNGGPMNWIDPSGWGMGVLQPRE